MNSSCSPGSAPTLPACSGCAKKRFCGIAARVCTPSHTRETIRAEFCSFSKQTPLLHSNGFYSDRQGGVQRLPNGNTLICSTHGGHVFEVTPDKKIVWEFVNPFVFGKAKCVIGDDEEAMPYKYHDNSMWGMIHRAFRYGADYPGLAGKELTPQGYVSGDDCPRFFSDFKSGSTLGTKK